MGRRHIQEIETGTRTKAGKVRTDHAQQESISSEAPITEERVASETSGVVGNFCVSRFAKGRSMSQIKDVK
jgi:hypothetical protein